MPDHATRQPEQQGFDFGVPVGVSARSRAGEPPGRRRTTPRQRPGNSSVQQDLDAALFGEPPPSPPRSAFTASGLAAPEDLSPAQAAYYRWWVSELESGRQVRAAGDYGGVLLTEILRTAVQGRAADAMRRIARVPPSLLSDQMQRALPSIRAALAYRAPDAGGLYGWRDAVVREHAIGSLPPRPRNAALRLSLRHPDRLAPLLVDLFADEIAASHAGGGRTHEVAHGLHVAIERWAETTGQHFTQWLGVAQPGAPVVEREKVSLLAIGGAGADGWAVSIPPGPDVLAVAARLQQLTRSVADHVGVVQRSREGEHFDLLEEQPELPDELLQAIADEFGGYGEGRASPYPPRRPPAWRRAGGYWPDRPPPDYLLATPARVVPLGVAYLRSQVLRLGALEPGDPALDAYLAYRQRFLRGEYGAVEAGEEGSRCRDEMLQLHIEALHVGWETQDLQEAAVRLAAVPVRLTPDGHPSGYVKLRRAAALADVRALRDGAVAWARTWADEWLAGRVDIGYGRHPLVGAGFGILAEADPDLAGRLLADFGVRLRHHPLPPDHEHFAQYRSRLAAAYAVCLRQWPIWYRSSFVRAMGGHPRRSATLRVGATDPVMRRKAVELPLATHDELDPRHLEGGSHIDRSVVGAVARQVAIVVRAQAGERQPRTRRPPLPEGVGDYLAEALGSYGAGGSPFRDLQRPPETQFADFAHGAEVTLADIDFDAVARAHADADHTARLLDVEGAVSSSGASENGAEAAEERVDVGDRAPTVCVPVRAGRAADVGAISSNGTGHAVVPDDGTHHGAPSDASPFSTPERELLHAIARGPISATDLRPLLPGVMIEAALERINNVALAHFGDLAVIEDGAALELNEAVQDLVLGGRS